MTQNRTPTPSDQDRPQLKKIYALCRLHDLGVSLSDFLANPFGILAAKGQADAAESIRNGYLPLTPRQAEIAARINADADGNILAFPDPQCAP